MASIAQIALAVVAIFGYFYTVIPVYQKERLAEQVAQYDGELAKLRPQIDESKALLAQLQGDRVAQEAAARSERERLAGELERLRSELQLAEDQREQIVGQLPYMTYRYRLPDGRPAQSEAQVRAALEAEFDKRFSSSIAFCASGMGFVGALFPRHRLGRNESTDSLWPFTQKEIAAWREHEAKYPLQRALECIDYAANRDSARAGADPIAPHKERLRLEMRQRAIRASAVPWIPPIRPEALWKELADGRRQIEADRLAEIAKVEREYGKWQSVIGASRRAIFQNNYEVGRQNADSQARGRTYQLESEALRKAEMLGESISVEVERLTHAGQE